MKKILFFFMLILLSCNQPGNILKIIKGDGPKNVVSDVQDNILTDITRYNPENLISDPNFKMTDEIQNQIDLFKYINSTYEHDFRDFYTEKLYTSRLFFSGEKRLFIDEIYVISDISQERTQYEFVFNNLGKLIKVSQPDDQNYRMEFSYTLNNQLSHGKNYKLFTPWTKTSGNNVTTYSPVRETEEVEFTYENGLLISDKYSSINPSVRIKDNGVYQYFKDNSGSDLRYIKYIRNLDFRSSSERLYCFNGENLIYITYKEGTISNPTPLLLRYIYLWSKHGNKTRILEYKLNFDTKKHEIEYTYNIDMDSPFKINKIEEIGSWRGTEDYYQYRYQDNNLIGYEIFRAILDIKGDLDNQKRDYKLTKAFLINP